MNIFLIIGILGIINVLAFLVMWQDKVKSTQGNEASRTPEGVLFLLCAVFGSVGVYVAMILLRHKNRKWYFQIGVPFLMFQNVATAYLVCQYFNILV